MSKLLTLLALSTALSLTACKTKPEEAKVDPVAKTTDPKPADPKPADPPAPNPTTQPNDPKPGDPRPASANGELPAECNDYKAAIDALAKCDKLPQATRDALKQSYDQTAAAWANVPAEGKAALSTACKSAADAVKQSAAACN